MGLRELWYQVVSGHSTTDTLSSRSLNVVAAAVLEGVLTYRNARLPFVYVGVWWY